MLTLTVQHPNMMTIKLKCRKGFLSRLVILFTIIITFYAKAQNAEAFNQIYTKTYLEISQKDFQKALTIADSLYTVSETPRFKAKSLMLSASLLQQSGEFKSAVEYALKAEKILEDTDDYVWKAKISGFLATQYRHLGLFDQSKKYIDETVEIIKNINDPRLVNQTSGFLMQEKAYYEIEQKNYKQSIQLVNEASRYFSLTRQENPFLSANNEQLLGLNYYHLGNYAKAMDYYQKALNKLNQMPDNFLKALVLNGMAKIYIEQKDPKRAKPLIDKAQQLAEESPYLSLKNEIYQSSQQYYALIKDIENLELSKHKQDSVKEKISSKTSAFINESYTNLKKDSEKNQKQSAQKSIIIILFLSVLTALIFYFLIYRRRQKQKFRKIEQILKELEQKNVSAPMESDETEQPDHQENEMISPDETEDTETEPQALMTAATEKKILGKLDRFEQTTLFTRSNVSLPYVAAYCSTNTKYLSYVVNTYKKKDFKNYINELRVKHIIHKLKNDSQYHKYKISSLAEEAGFSSQSKFAAAFRKVTDVSPSEFLDHLKSQHLN
ncbi:helix-turn-helix domain-containing protein [Epilithonimonas arachidiradicis]|uniref:AraC-like DNA-binding protein n=2 Tax=Epilithonimonas arachidiradicis TaxID=1617282 RepID=A0A420CKS4_9FLAO|nr:helix-turn-helix domain-containing protein [Epilithonimonas arachidiradicis]RKE79110.1 AraC-like DNA-binding protein [Epilithonimonas arachidiradicis]GGG60329.1 transcriptional regulator [Epilithonimonas arachidiradicis]